MTELNDLPESPAEPQNVEPDSIDPHDAPWPADTAVTSDAAADSALDRLAAIRSVPLSEHSSTYAKIHDDLMAALDAEER